MLILDDERRWKWNKVEGEEDKKEIIEKIEENVVGEGERRIIERWELEREEKEKIEDIDEIRREFKRMKRLMKVIGKEWKEGKKKLIGVDLKSWKKGGGRKRMEGISVEMEELDGILREGNKKVIEIEGGKEGENRNWEVGEEIGGSKEIREKEEIIKRERSKEKEEEGDELIENEKDEVFVWSGEDEIKIEIWRKDEERRKGNGLKDEGGDILREMKL